MKHVGDGYVRSTSADLRSGTEVEVWITGPVRQSCPIQADPDTIVALE